MFYYWGSTPTLTDSYVPKQFNVPLQVNKFACGEEHLIMLSGGTLKGWVPIIMELQEMEVMTMDTKHSLLYRYYMERVTLIVGGIIQLQYRLDRHFIGEEGNLTF